MLTLNQRRRPTRFDDVRGQEIPVEVMRRAAVDPDRAARVYLFHGYYGCGKTTLARVFAKALNCEAVADRPCGRCASCLTGMDASPYYQEYDCGAVGSVEDVRKIKENLVLDSSLARYRVVVFDEFHLASKQAQSALLKVIEDLSANTFVIFATTDCDRVLPTVRSRAVELFFRRLTDDEACDLLVALTEAEGYDLPFESLHLIATATGGHARDAVKSLEVASVVGADAATACYVDAKEAVEAVLWAVRKHDLSGFDVALCRSVGCLRSRYVDALYSVVYEMLRPDTESSLAKAWGSDAFKLFKLLVQPWAAIAMKRDDTLAAMLRVVWGAFAGTAQTTARESGTADGDRFKVVR